MNTKIRKAVLIAGGYSTRMLPFTRLVPKELLPLKATPVINLLIDECAAAGIEEIFVVTRPDNTLLSDYYKANTRYQEYLVKHKKDEFLPVFNVSYPKDLQVRYIQEDESLPYGDALGLLMLKEELIHEYKFLVLFADDIILSDTSSVKELIKHASSSPSVATLSVVEKAKEEMLSFGNIYVKEGTENQLSRIVRKPKADDITTNLVMCGQTVLSGIIYEYLANGVDSGQTELDTAVAISTIAQTHVVDMKRVHGHWVTIGTPKEYLKANIASHVLSGELKKTDLIDFINTL